MIKVAQVVKALAVSVLVGMLYGAVAGAAFGTVLAPIIGTIFGFGFGAIGGVVFGVIGGATGGVTGWGFGGFVGGLVSSSLLNPGRPTDVGSLAPAFILAAIGIAIGFAVSHTKPEQRPRLPLGGWLRTHRHQATLLHGFEAVHLVMAVMATLWGASIAHDRFTAPVQPGGLISVVND